MSASTEVKEQTVAITSKWPACLITGPKVTEDQAREFIFKTDFVLRDPEYRTNNKSLEAQIDKWLYPGLVEDDTSGSFEHFHDNYSYREKMHERYGLVNLEYLYTARVESCYFGGTYGIVRRDGQVHFFMNIGKWPTEEEVLKDLQAIADNFPWLEFTMRLWNEEESEISGVQTPCFMAEVKRGAVTVIEAPEPFDTNLIARLDIMQAVKQSCLGRIGSNSDYGGIQAIKEEFKEFVK